MYRPAFPQLRRRVANEAQTNQCALQELPPVPCLSQAPPLQAKRRPTDQSFRGLIVGAGVRRSCIRRSIRRGAFSPVAGETGSFLHLLPTLSARRLNFSDLLGRQHNAILGGVRGGVQGFQTGGRLMPQHSHGDTE